MNNDENCVIKILEKLYNYYNVIKWNNIFNENEEFISTNKNKVENDNLLNKKIKEIYSNYVLESLKNDVFKKRNISKLFFFFIKRI